MAFQNADQDHLVYDPILKKNVFQQESEFCENELIKVIITFIF
jgi:hypothetical protein